MNQRIKYFVMDVDGTLTDGKIYMGSDGEIMKSFNIKDGYGIHDILIPGGYTPVIITGRQSTILEMRCKELGIDELFQGVKDKLSELISFLKDNKSNLSEVAYIGDDLNDLHCINAVSEAGGVTGCPADAVECLKKKCQFICRKDGGNGAVREFIEWVLAR